MVHTMSFGAFQRYVVKEHFGRFLTAGLHAYSNPIFTFLGIILIQK